MPAKLAMPPKVVVAQLGARRHYLVPRALAEAGHLERFYTDVYFGRRQWLDPALGRVFGRRARPFTSRCDPALSRDLVRDFPSVRLFGLAGRSSDAARWLVTGRRFSSSVAKAGFGAADSVLAFSSAALEIFEASRLQRLRTMLDHATAPRDRELAAVVEEEQRFPGWAARPALPEVGLAEYVERQASERQLADRILCGSTFVARELESAGTAPSKLRVVPLGVAGHPEGAKAGRTRHDGLHVLFVGSEGLRKGLGYLTRAVDRLCSPGVRLRVAGDPGLSKHGMLELRRVCEECRPVPRAEIGEWYRWADVLVLPSVSDTFGLVILEAMAAGLPVIASVASGGPDVVRDDVDGWIVPVRDPEAIAERLEALAMRPELVRTMGDAARSRAAEFSPAAYGRRLLEAIA